MNQSKEFNARKAYEELCKLIMEKGEHSIHQRASNRVTFWEAYLIEKDNFELWYEFGEICDSNLISLVEKKSGEFKYLNWDQDKKNPDNIQAYQVTEFIDDNGNCIKSDMVDALDNEAVYRSLYDFVIEATK